MMYILHRLFTPSCLTFSHFLGRQSPLRETMAMRVPRLRYFARSRPSQLAVSSSTSRRQFTASATRSTDGVFRALTENRVQTPWVEALRRQKQEGKDPTKATGKPQTPADRDLSPRTMSDSYHSVVSTMQSLLTPFIRLTQATRFYRSLRIHGCSIHTSTRRVISALEPC